MLRPYARDVHNLYRIIAGLLKQYVQSLIHISELTRLLRVLYGVFCLKKKRIEPGMHDDLARRVIFTFVTDRSSF